MVFKCVWFFKLFGVFVKIRLGFFFNFIYLILDLSVCILKILIGFDIVGLGISILVLLVKE